MFCNVDECLHLGVTNLRFGNGERAIICAIHTEQLRLQFPDMNIVGVADNPRHILQNRAGRPQRFTRNPSEVQDV